MASACSRSSPLTIYLAINFGAGDHHGLGGDGLPNSPSCRECRGALVHLNYRGAFVQQARRGFLDRLLQRQRNAAQAARPGKTLLIQPAAPIDAASRRSARGLFRVCAPVIQPKLSNHDFSSGS